MRHGPLLLALIGASLAFASPAVGQAASWRYRSDSDLALRSADDARRLAEHCAEVGQAACDRERRESQREYDRAVAEGEARHCAELGPTACRAEREARIAEERRGLFGPPVVVVGLLGLLWLHRRITRPRPRSVLSAGPERRDLAALDVALAREPARALRGSIAEAISAAGSSVAALPAISRLVADARPSWTHVAVRGWPLASAEDAETRLRSVRAEVGARPQLDVAPPPREAGKGYRGGPAPLPETENDAYALLSIVVLSSQEIPEGAGAPVDRALALLAVFDALRPPAVEAVDIAWLHEHPDDTSTAHDLAGRVPRLVAAAK